MDKSLLENTAKVVSNQMASPEATECERALGSRSNLVRAVTLGLQNSDLIGLIRAYLVMNYCLGKPFAENPNKNTEQIKSYKEALSDFINFLTNSAIELEAQDNAK